MSIDTETTVVDLKRDVPELVLVTLHTGDLTLVVFARDCQLDLWPVLKDREVVFHNAGFDLAVLERAGCLTRDQIAFLIKYGPAHDTMILDQLLRLATGGEGPGRPGDAHYAKTYDGTLPARSLTELARVYLHETLEKGAVRLSFGGLTAVEQMTAEQRDYACQDAETTLRVYRVLSRQVEPFVTKTNFGPLTEAIQVGAKLALDDIGRRGLLLDLDRLGRFEEEACLNKETAAATLRERGFLKRKTKRGTAEKLNEKALRTHLSGLAASLGLHPPLVPSGRFVSLRREDWDEHTDRDPVIQAFVDYKKAEKRISTFTKKWKAAAQGRVEAVVRPQYRVLVATGRTSCHSPNLQQVPRRQGSLREVFASRPGRCFYELDYVQLELVCVAQCCISCYMQSTLAEVLNAGQDVHTLMASRIYNCTEEAVTKEQRFLAKMCNFGFWGGMGAKTFQRHCWNLGRLEVSLDEARDIRATWLKTFPEASLWLREAGDAGRRVEHELLESKPRIIWSHAAVAAVLRGETEDWPEVALDPRAETIWVKLQLAGEGYQLLDPLFQEYARAVEERRGSRALYDFLRWREMRTLTGRLRAPVSYTEFLNGQFQGLAADGCKLALFELWRHGLEVSAFVHDSILLEAKEERQPRLAADIMVAQMRRVTPDVQVGVEITGPTRFWGQQESFSEVEQMWSS